MAGIEPSGDLRHQRKLAYYRVLSERDPEFGGALADLYRQVDRILAPFDRNSFRWDLLDAAHGGEPEENIRAFREIVAECERSAAAADPEEAARWRQESARPHRIAEVLSAAEVFRVRWLLPRDATRDLIDAYLSGDEHLAPLALDSQPKNSRLIRLEPPPRHIYGSDLGAVISDDQELHADWVIPYDPAPPAGDTRKTLDQRLERLFAFLREQSYRQAAMVEAEDHDGEEAAPATLWEQEPFAAGALALYLSIHQGRSWQEIGARLGVDSEQIRDQVVTWATDLGIALASNSC
jgi:hypothetical protein